MFLNYYHNITLWIMLFLFITIHWNYINVRIENTKLTVIIIIITGKTASWAQSTADFSCIYSQTCVEDHPSRLGVICGQHIDNLDFFSLLIGSTVINENITTNDQSFLLLLHQFYKWLSPFLKAFPFHVNKMTLFIKTYCPWSHGLRPKKLSVSVAVPPAPVRVPSQRPLAPSVSSVVGR